MKRFGFLLAAMCALLAPGVCQVLFHDDFQMDVNRFGVGQVNKSWTLYNDDNTPASSPFDLSHFDQAWNVTTDEDGSRYAVAVSFFTKAGTADRWLVSPAIDLSSAQKPMLAFRMRRMENAYRDGAEIKLSTTGAEKADFTVSLQKTNAVPNNWTYYTIDLSEYIGQTVHIAFIQNSSDKYMIGLDDVSVFDSQEESASVTALTVAATTVMQQVPESIAAKAVLFNTGSQNISSYTLRYQTVTGDVTGEVVREEISEVDIEPYKTHDINLSVSLNKTGNDSLVVWLEKINGKDISSLPTMAPLYSIRHATLPRKNLLLEMFSSGMCTSCAPLNRWVHPIFISEKANVPDNSGNFSVVKYPVNIPSPGDPTVTQQTSSRASMYGVNSAPSVFMNGRAFRHTDTTIGRHLRDSIAKFRQTTLPTGITASLERDGGTFRIHTTVTNYLPDEQDYNIVVCLIEDSLHHQSIMHNGEQDMYNVVRQMLPDVVGSPVSPDVLGKVIEKDFEYTFDASSPTVYSSFDNMGAVVFLQSQKDNRVAQAFYLKAGYSVANDRQKPASRQLSLYPNPVNDHCTLVFDAQQGGQGKMQLIDNQGRMIRNKNISLQTGKNTFEIETSSLVSGFYFVRICNEQGIFTHKIMKR